MNAETDSFHPAAPSSGRTSGDAVPSQPLPAVGQTVNARIDFYNDLRDEGLGVEHCAKRGDTLVVRRIVPGIKNCLVVSHEDVTDGRGFCVAPGEIDYVYPEAQPSNEQSASGSPARTVDGQMNEGNPHD